MAFFFTSPEHKQRWLSAMLKNGKVYQGKLDPEYGAALYILTSNTETWEKTQFYVSSGGIKFERILREGDWSGGYMSLLGLAANLFNDHFTASPVDVATRLDEENFQVALTALQVRRVNWSLGEIASKAELHTIEMDIRRREQEF